MGLPPELVASINGAQPEGFEVWPENWVVVEAFLSVQTQWRTAPLADGRVLWLGLDYGAARGWLEGLAVELSPRLLRGVAMMERAAAHVLNGGRG